MRTIAFKRIFTDNNHYSGYKRELFMDSLAYVVQEFLYTRRDQNDYMWGLFGIPLYDFMSLIAIIIPESHKELGKATIKDYINALRQPHGSDYVEFDIVYQKDGMVIYNAGEGLILSLLWTAYIYAKMRYIVEKTEEWKRATSMLYNQMVLNYPEDKEEMKNDSPFKYSKEAIAMLHQHIKKTLEKEAQEQQSDHDQPEPTQQQESIKAEKNNKELEEAKLRIAELEAENNKLKEFHEVDEQFKEIQWHDKVRLAVLLRLLQNDGVDLEKYGNKAAAARLMSSITGLPLQTCKNFCTEPVVSSEAHKEELLQMNLELQRLGLKISV